MPPNEIEILKRALERQKKARQQAERILEEKSKELFDTAEHLKRANARLNSLLDEKSDEMDAAFLNITDPYVVMDLNFEVIRTNESAKEFLGFDYTKESINLASLVHPDYLQYTQESIGTLLEVGSLRNYRAKIFTKKRELKYVQINASLIHNRAGKPIAAQGIIRDITQEMEIEALLSEQRKQLDIIVENSPLGIVLTDKGKIIKSNAAMLQMLGYSHEELKKLSVSDISSYKDVKGSKELIEQMNKGELDHFTLHKKYKRKDGSLFMAKTSVSAVRNTAGDIGYQVAIVEDITREVQAREQLEASENRLATLIKNLEMGVLLEDQNRSIALTNSKFCQMFGIQASPEQMIGADCSNAAEESKGFFKNPDKFVKRIDEILRKRETVLADELELIDGRILERDYIPIIIQGDYKGHLWTYRDITLRKTFKRNLQAEKDKYSSIIANMNLGLIEVDNEDHIQLVNQSFCTMSGYNEEELIGRKASEVLKVFDKSKIAEKNARRLDNVSDSYEIQVKDKNGQTRHWLISGAPRYNEAQQVIGSIGIHLDITESKQLQIQKEHLLGELQKSNKELQEYAHIVSHDLKSPLRSISALASWLKEDYQDVLREDGVNQLQMMQEKIEGMDSLISGILKYSSIDRKAADETEVDLNQVVAEIREIIFIPEHVKVIIMDPLPVLVAEKTKIHQLFQNLLSNAVMHIETDEGIVQVFCQECKSHWKFSVKDNGVGIPEQYHEKIFKIFQSLNKREGSTGIGLSIVKKIVDLYSGKVWVESEVGKGTTFHFTLKKNRE
ncbi:PAS domain S-box protein [Robiginitalea sp. IMCC43444]|uniref:PAS domain S-box protein n=1 Tax=Robiginitalea sp. IMCC43444 TaxID=3459121 RepID=UPI0040419A00